MKVLKFCVFLYIHLKSSGHKLGNKGQITFSNMDTWRVLINCWLWEWVLQYVACVVIDPINISRALSSVVCHCLPVFFLLHHYHNTKHLPVQILTWSPYFKNTCLPRCFADWQFQSPLTCQTAKWQHHRNLKFWIPCFSNLVFLDSKWAHICGRTMN